ncbi:phosphoserine phosphatase 1 [Clostridium tepidiprofundi DSM 19306]|uniref:Phosphoserine phosphatase 1 n=1 Tax=Clostridium tepidiprofundi DSM 19306 TaxID=1121338 RepID=A0A151APB0_9CLOT|nr:histidine phosphatase family protein [Clostridium tepidiprofundi]KYH29445.1 phosphoserine phosphatase 1 [Clostridium tepidiprofundi DSM 19306]
MLKILLVRHGESLADIEKCHEGRADFPLTEKGELQASLLAKYLKEKYKIDKIICSPLKRAYCTARKIGEEFNLDLIVNDDLMEMNNGLLAGLTFKEAEVKYPLPVGGRKIYDPIPGGESIIEFRMRVEKFWNKFLDKNYKSDEKKCICIIAHGGTISMLNKAIFRLPVDTEIKFPTGDTGFHEWIIKDNERYIIKMNCQEHLCNNIYEKYEIKHI